MTTTVTKEQIKEIAEQLDCGFSCYFNKKDNELLFVPDPDHHPDMEMSAWKSELKKIRKNPNNFITIDPPSSSESFEIMAEFAESLEDGKLRDELIQALNKRKPFREFKFVIDNSGDFRQKWFDFKSTKLQERVEDELRYVNDEEE